MATKKKTSVGKTILVSIVALLLGILVGYIGNSVFVNYSVEFYLVGNETTSVSIGNEYVDEGVVCTYRGTDYSEEVVLTYYDESLNIVTKIDTNVLATYYVVYNIWNEKFSGELTRIVNIVEYDDLEINFLMFDNNNAGDCIYIKAGDTDILVDAGTTKGDAQYIYDYLTDSDSNHSYVSDNKLEYVIATHAHEDHIAAFVGTKENGTRNGIFSRFEIEVLIDFPNTEATTDLYQEYLEEVEKLKTNGTIRYSALECYKNENGASRIINIAAGIEIEILYNYYYENNAKKNENLYSVCFMLRRGEQQFLFTGDLENDKKGEEYLVQYNDLGEVYLFKAGHHGSETSSSSALLSEIKPEVVVVTAAAFTKEYTKDTDVMFPSKACIDNLALYNVKHLYVSRMLSKDGEKFSQQETVPANGHIVVKADSKGTYVECSHSNDDFYNFDIFKQYRSWTTN